MRAVSLRMLTRDLPASATAISSLSEPPMLSTATGCFCYFLLKIGDFVCELQVTVTLFKYVEGGPGPKMTEVV